MSEDNGFVERPTAFTYRDDTRVEKLLQTAENGKAILMKATTAGGGYRAALWDRGYKLHLSTRKAPPGLVYAWAEKVHVTSE